jgi:hypothetical protein
MIFNDAIDIKLGENQVKRIYKGNKLVWIKRLKSITGVSPSDYIPTDIKVNSIFNTTIEAKGYLSLDGDCGLYGARVSSSSTIVDMVRGVLSKDNNIAYFVRHYISRCTESVADTYDRVLFPNELDEFEVHSQIANCYVKKDNDIKYILRSVFGNDSSIPVPFILLGINNNGNVSNVNGTRTIEYFRVLENGILTHDLVPILDDDDIPCMYDMITDKRYYVANGGTLSYETY